jgi:hypothetical protein
MPEMNKTKIIVAGGRDFQKWDLLKETLDDYLKDVGNPEIVSGAARGADTLAVKYAKLNNIPFVLFPAKWDIHGKAAGPIRNTEMAKYANRLVCFWDQKSKGTKNMIETARKNNLEVKVVFY